jgi:hypothetical protein
MRIVDFINAGGSITWILVAMNIVGLSLILWRFFILKDFKKRIDSEARLLTNDLHQQLTTKNLMSHLDLVKDSISSRVHELEVE